MKKYIVLFVILLGALTGSALAEAKKLDQVDPPWSTPLTCGNCARPQPTKSPVTRSPTPAYYPEWTDTPEPTWLADPSPNPPLYTIPPTIPIDDTGVPVSPAVSPTFTPCGNCGRPTATLSATPIYAYSSTPEYDTPIPAISITPTPTLEEFGTPVCLECDRRTLTPGEKPHR